MTDEKAFMLITILTTVALALAIVMAFAGVDQMKQPAQNWQSDYKENPFD